MEVNWVILGWLIDMTLNGFVEIGRVQFEDSPPAFPMIREPSK